MQIDNGDFISRSALPTEKGNLFVILIVRQVMVHEFILFLLLADHRELEITI
jgi:hypothetical protein